ncbi:MAG: outer membrane lipoprotein carrier protein LolA [Acidobacteria bacterium]|nr:outer membrane lipoprotein carrier protein LolA [Acidobacteriota bacterium]
MMRNAACRAGLRGWRAVVAAALAAVLPTVPAAPPAEPAAALAGAQQLQDLARRIERRYREQGAFRASFHQRYESTTFGAEDEARGTIHVSPPGRILWEYSQPKGQKAVYDGERWWLLVPEDREVKIKDQVPGLSDPLTDLLAGRIDLLKVFAVTESSAPPAAKGRVVLELVPRDVRDDLEMALIEADRASGDVRRLEIVDPLGNRLVYDLGAPVAEKPLPASAFAMKVPAGFNVTRE